MGPLRFVSCSWVAIASLAPAAGQDLSACTGVLPLANVGHLQPCLNELLQITSEEETKQLQKAVKTLEESRTSCTAANDKATEWGCKALSDLAYELFAQAAAALHMCLAGSADECTTQSGLAMQAQLSAWHATELRHLNSPAEKLVTYRLSQLREELPPLLQQGPHIGPEAWQVATKTIDKVKHWVSGYIWRETHWLWLQDSLHAGKVVQTTWGPPEEWLKFGMHDAHADAPLNGAPPLYTFHERLGMRWELLVALLQELRQRRGDPQGHLQLVEIGVFAGHLSHFVLRDCDFVHLLGVDPYIGSDGTFPGNFSRTLDADVALYKAASVMEAHSDRAQLWPMTSEAAASQLEDGSVDAIFVDGCHLYDCVQDDFRLWLPKLRRGLETLVAGHDFSPQWPGVVRAVHEQRAGGQEVNLATDWMYWWWEQRP